MINSRAEVLGLGNGLLRYRKAILVFALLNVCDFVTTLYLQEANPISVGNLPAPLFAVGKLLLVGSLVAFLLYRNLGHWIKRVNLVWGVPVVVFNLAGLLVGIGIHWVTYFIARYG